MFVRFGDSDGPGEAFQIDREFLGSVFVIGLGRATDFLDMAVILKRINYFADGEDRFHTVVNRLFVVPKGSPDVEQMWSVIGRGNCHSSHSVARFGKLGFKLPPEGGNPF